jgi:signal transduction histidine kinase
MNTPSSPFAALRPGHHLCFPYETPDEKDAALVTFVREGLERNERCLHIGTPEEHERLLAGLRAQAVATDRALARGALVLKSPRETYYRTGRFTAEDALAMVEEHLDAALADGFLGLRGTGESAGPLPDELWAEVLRYEALLNERFARRPFVGFCRFPTGALPADRLRDVLRVHPQALVRGECCDNPYYERAELALSDDSQSHLDWQLHQLRTHHRARRHLEDMATSAVASYASLVVGNEETAAATRDLRESVSARDRFLSVLADDLADPLFALKREVHALGSGDDGTPAPERLEAAARHLRRLSSAIDQVRDVARLLQTPGPELVDGDLVELVADVARRHGEGTVATAQVEIVSTSPARGRWDRGALRRLVSALVADAVGDGAVVTVTVTADESAARLTVDAGAAPTTPARGPRLDDRLARELARAAGGRLVDVPAPRDGGSRVVVELPRRPFAPS